MINYLLNHDYVFAFNIWNFTSAKAIMDAAASCCKPVILQTSPGVYDKIDTQGLRGFVTDYAKRRGIQVWLHLDHCKNQKTVEDAIDKGWDSVMIDASHESIENNITITNQVIEVAHKNGVLVEAEVGRLHGVEDDIQVIDGEIADEEDISCFLRSAEVDMIAVAFGNAHGMYQGSPRLHYELIDYVAALTDTPFVVHGASGLNTEALSTLIHKKNVKKINISTEVKMAYRAGIIQSVQMGLLEEKRFQATDIEDRIYTSIYTMAEQKFRLL